MSITVDEYADVLNSEVWVEVNKLREYARHGIPREVRGVCIYLVLHSSPNRLSLCALDEELHGMLRACFVRVVVLFFTLALYFLRVQRHCCTELF